MALSKRPLRSLVKDESGAIGVVTAVFMVVLLLISALVADIGYAFVSRNQLQATADAASLSGVIALPSGNATVKTKAEAIATLNMPAANYGTVLTDADVTTGNWATATRVFTPGGTPLNAVQVITRRSSTNSNPMPTFFATIAGLYSLNTSVRAVAAAGAGHPYCILALASSAPASTAVEFQSNGAPKADLNGCGIMSNASMDCNGHDLNAGFGDASGTNNGCGKVESSGVPKVADPYSGLASNIPSNPCGSSYPQEPSKKKDPALPSSNIIQPSSGVNLGNKTYCGDVQLAGNVTLTGSNVIVIRNGKLDMNGKTITTASGAAATIIFAGGSGGGSTSFSHIPTGGGTINISSPTSGIWSGVAIYQDPSLTSGVDISDAGNSPSWNISGLVYLPHSSVTFSGVVGKATSGLACFVLVVDDITINGTASMLSGSCAPQGLTLPASIGHPKLVA